MSLERWNERYRAGEGVGREPAPIVVEAAALAAPGCALDLACGAGRNALWLAARGWEVTALDGASEAIRIVREADRRIDARLIDLEIGTPLPFDDESFDLVLIVDYLWRPLFDEAKRVVRRGGLFAGAIRTTNIDPAYRVEPGELAARFGDWQIVVAREGERSELIARKPTA